MYKLNNGILIDSGGRCHFTNAVNFFVGETELGQLIPHNDAALRFDVFRADEEPNVVKNRRDGNKPDLSGRAVFKAGEHSCFLNHIFCMVSAVVCEWPISTFLGASIYRLV